MIKAKIAQWCIDHLNLEIPPAKKFTEIQKVRAMSEIMDVENVVDIFETQKTSLIRHIALRCSTNDEIIFYRGALFTLTNLLKSLKSSKKRLHELTEVTKYEVKK
jgi:hypothetical protein